MLRQACGGPGFRMASALNSACLSSSRRILMIPADDCHLPVNGKQRQQKEIFFGARCGVAASRGGGGFEKRNSEPEFIFSSSSSLMWRLSQAKQPCKSVLGVRALCMQHGQDKENEGQEPSWGSKVRGQSLSETLSALADLRAPHTWYHAARRMRRK